MMHAMAERRGPDRWLFDVWSRFYDAPLVQRLTYRPEHDAVLRALRSGGHERLLDVGCGTGLLSARIVRALPGCGVVGCDFSRGMLERAAARRRGARWVRGDALRLPFADASFDVLVSTEAFHWFPDQPAALTEFRRVLEPGGRLLVSLINPPVAALSRLTQAGSALLGEPLYWPTRSRMRRQVEAAGFRVEAQRQVFRMPAGLILPSVLTEAVRPTEGAERPLP
jgi:ubiquinone/menaquinone biosynthesis C-methylase UbiE